MLEFQPTILYEDAQLCVCIKPAGVLSEGGTPGGMPALLAGYYRAQGRPDFVAGVHRLDRIVGGAMVFSRRRDVTGKLIAAVAAHEVTKEYLAVLCGRPDREEATLEDLLFHDSTKNKTYVVQRPRKGVREARLSYRVLASVEMPQGLRTLVRVQLYTGRTHQIRAQFSARGLPLLGDIRYGSRDPACDCALWSNRLCFAHPTRRAQVVDCVAPPPDCYPWTLFPPQLVGA